jgi:hypothetical protein
MRLERARGTWPGPVSAWSLEGRWRRLAWDDGKILQPGPQRFFGLAGSAVRERGRWRLEATARAGHYQAARGVGVAPADQGKASTFERRVAWLEGEVEVQWGPAEPATRRVPAVSLRLGALAFADGGGHGPRSWGWIRGERPLRSFGHLRSWIGLDGGWDRDHVVLWPRLRWLWSDSLGRRLFWLRLGATQVRDPWWEEAAGRDFVTLELGRHATQFYPFGVMGTQWHPGDWSLELSARGGRALWPRTWERLAASRSSLLHPVSASHRWLAWVRARITSPWSGPVRLKAWAEAFADGSEPDLALQAPGRAGLRLEVRRGRAAGAALVLEARATTPGPDGEELPAFVSADLEVWGRVRGEWDVWARVEDVTGDPARVWPFVEGSRRRFRLGVRWTGGRDGS